MGQDKDKATHISRMFKLNEAPTFYPTTEEFSNPYDYIKKIQPSAENFGICKIVPPKLLSPETYLNLKSSARRPVKTSQSDTVPVMKNEEYIAQLFQYHSDSGQPIYKPPHLDHKPVDLYKLRTEVAQRGGFSKVVTTEKKWAEVGRAMNYSGKTCTSLSNSLKTMYSKFVMPFELHISNSESSSPLKRPLDDSGDARMNHIHDDPETDSINSDHSRSMLLCDGCNRGFHIYCLRPPLKKIPKTDWFCPQCLGEVEGFRLSGDVASLYTFQKDADKFKAKWFEDKRNGRRKSLNRITRDEIEEEFWEVMENGYQDLKIENISNLPTAQYGGGFPTVEKNPSEEDVFFSWNPNVIALLPDCLFSHIKSNIPELVSPRLNAGMCFSSSAWRQEPHCTYLVDYMHIGEVKTWYSVPASDELKFTTAAREFLSNSVKQEADFPFCLHAMISPKVLIDNSVEVFAVDQQQGEIVITFPGSYHASFSHGFNLGESVNIATSDWHRFGQSCVNRYKEYRKSPYFSHDNLLVTIANDDQSIRTAVWILMDFLCRLRHALREMVDRELESRNEVRANISPLREVIDSTDYPMSSLQCSYCHAFSYLSSLGCECGNTTLCPDHFEHQCECEAIRKYFRLRWSDDELKDMARKVEERADIPVEWVRKLQNALLNNPIPSIEMLKVLLVDAENIPVEIEEAAYLKQFIERAEQWSGQAHKVISRHHSDFVISPEFSLDDTYISELISEAAALNLNSPEVEFLDQLEQKIQGFKSKVDAVVADGNADIEELRKLYTLGSSFDVNIKELSLLENLIRKKDWYRSAQATHDNPHSTDVAKELVNAAKEHEIPE
ncbi:JmjC-domain-containing protein, partial [Basidiobolus meristosporus CBS 931.73]